MVTDTVQVWQLELDDWFEFNGGPWRVTALKEHAKDDTLVLVFTADDEEEQGSPFTLSFDDEVEVVVSWEDPE